jgi:hypothetical protein
MWFEGMSYGDRHTMIILEMAVYLVQWEIDEILRMYNEGLITTPEMVMKIANAVNSVGR